MTPHEQFLNDTLKGLKSTPKYLPDKYYYDSRGNEYFFQLTQAPGYYLTTCEKSIFKQYKGVIASYFVPGKDVNVIEFGAGDASKTLILLEHLHRNKINFTYCPVDFSADMLNRLRSNIAKSVSSIDLQTFQCDYFKALSALKTNQNDQNIVLFIGSSFGGLNQKEQNRFLKRLYHTLNKGDLLLIGFDLKKEPAILYKAYHDNCRDWCYYFLSLFKKLQIDLKKENFEYYTTYCPVSGDYNFYFLSNCEQNLTISSCKEVIHFDPWEPLLVGKSQKFSIEDIDRFSKLSGFIPLKIFCDKDSRFVDALWRKA